MFVKSSNIRVFEEDTSAAIGLKPVFMRINNNGIDLTQTLK
ncbi:unnamed protein product, partial [marine sediment metagenome]